MSGPGGPVIDIERTSLYDGDRVLVCTNGLTDAVDDEKIATLIAADQSPDEQCQALIDQAFGADDDVTVLVARYHIPR
jgi:PPM family protein phosphatase